MDGKLWTLFSIAAVAFSLGAAPATRDDPTEAMRRAMRDDAELTSVSFVDDTHGWAVGDRGVIWHTSDGGQNWQWQNSGVECRLRSVCFIDRENGWAAGGIERPHLDASVGVMLFTHDGGQTWTRDQSVLLPTISRVQFFSVEQGWAVADSSALFPVGVFHTNNGGRAWSPLTSRQITHWTVADFFDPSSGALAGPRGKCAAVRERMLDQRMRRDSDIREARAIRLTSATDGWMAGDGGLLLVTQDGGQSWRPPAALPGGNEQFDWRAVATHQRECWVAGTPGSRVMHSTNFGETWESHATGQNLPINALCFVDASLGFAVGAMGTILSTSDGGQTWTKQHGTGDRAAILAVFGDSAEIPPEALARLAAHDGYLTVVERLVHRDAATATHQHAREQAAMSSIGCSVSEAAWGFPASERGAKLTLEMLIDQWNQVHEGRALEMLESHLVRQIRTYRPELILTSSPRTSGESPISHAINQVVIKAVAGAANQDRFGEQIDMCGLEPWTVKKVVGVLPRGKVGTINVNTHQMAPRLSRSLADYAADARGLLGNRQAMPETNWGFGIFIDARESTATPQDFFSGLDLPPSSNARRAVPGIGRANLETARAVAERHRNLQAILAYTETSGRGGATLLAQIGDLTRGLDAATAGQAIFELAQAYYQSGQWDLAAETFELLAEKYPNHPRTIPTLVWLVEYWSSGEAACRSRIAPRQDVPPANAPGDQIPNMIAAQVRPTRGRATSIPPADPARKTVPSQSALAVRRAKAAQFAQALQRSDAQSFSEFAVQFPLAVALRGETTTRGGRFLSTVVRTRAHDAWWECARVEEWLSQATSEPTTKEILSAERASAKPRLDGLLEDDLWQHARRAEMPVSKEAEGATAIAVMLAYDDEYLYIAIEAECATNVEYPIESRIRQRDTELAACDRVELFIDVDRDWTTFYRMAIDYRGWTNDDCWHDASWNPQWYVASGRGERSWTAEAAIPLAQLATEPPQPNTVWALGLIRVLPGVTVQGWSAPSIGKTSPADFGLLIFE